MVSVRVKIALRCFFTETKSLTPTCNSGRKTPVNRRKPSAGPDNSLSLSDHMYQIFKEPDAEDKLLLKSHMSNASVELFLSDSQLFWEIWLKMNINPNVLLTVGQLVC